jgi:hypothetical protein
MKILIAGVVIVALILAVVSVPYCAREFKAAESDNTTAVSPNLSLVERQRLLEQRVGDLAKVIDQLQRENAQLRRDLDALSK